jgi:menaquinone-dependent protoporphyrinogen oxidase
MKAVVFFATREGQTRKIAERIASDLGARDMDVDLHDVRTLRAPIDWPAYTIACVAASVHIGHHEREMIEFGRGHRIELERVGAVFVSVTLSEAGAEDPHAPPERRARAAADAQRMIDVFVKETGWKPARSLPVAGALAYTQYNVLVRYLMKRIARAQGAPTDTTRDYEFTDWNAVDRFVEEVTRSAAGEPGRG